MNLKDKNIILTGGSLGIGRETAKSLMKKEHKRFNYWEVTRKIKKFFQH